MQNIDDRIEQAAHDEAERYQERRAANKESKPSLCQVCYQPVEWRSVDGAWKRYEADGKALAEAARALISETLPDENDASMAPSLGAVEKLTKALAAYDAARPKANP
jgi:hypothetical protein